MGIRGLQVHKQTMKFMSAIQKQHIMHYRSISRFTLVLAIFAMIPFTTNAQKITLDDMRDRYKAFSSNEIQPEPTEYDEIVVSYYYGYEPEEKRYNNPRTSKGNQKYDVYRTHNLRTKEYRNRKHYWSFLYYQEEPYDPREHLHDGNFKSWGDFIKYLVLDSIEGIDSSTWKKELEKKRRFLHPIDTLGTLQYAKKINQTIFCLCGTVNLMGYICRPTYLEFNVRHGIIKDFNRAYKKGFDRAGDAYEEAAGMLIDGSGQRRRTNLYVVISRKINSIITADSIPRADNDYDILIKFKSNKKVDAELLSSDKLPGKDFVELRDAIRKLPKNFLNPLWTTEGKRLPGIYMKARLHDGKWFLGAESFIIPDSAH